MSHQDSPLPPTRRRRWFRRPVPLVTRLLLDTTVAVFLAQVFTHYYYGIDYVGECLAFSAEAWAAHDYWTVLTYAWAHAVEFPGLPGFFWIHIAANMMLLYSLGPNLEEYLGPWRFLGLYLGGAIAASLTWLAFNSLPGESIIGASGAAFSLIAAAGTLAPRARIMVYVLFIVPIRMTLGLLAFAICAVEAASIFFNWMPFVGHSAHLGGAAFGCLYCLVLRGLQSRRRANIAI